MFTLPSKHTTVQLDNVTDRTISPLFMQSVPLAMKSQLPAIATSNLPVDMQRRAEEMTGVQIPLYHVPQDSVGTFASTKRQHVISQH
jgi:hypothetical protein